MVSLPYNNRAFAPQALATGLHARVTRNPNNAMISTTVPVGRSAKRNTTQINYAEIENFNDEDFEESPAAAAASSMPTSSSAPQKIMLRAARTTKYPHDIDNEHKIRELSKNDVLVPIRLSVEYNNGNSKFADFFMWNLSDTLVTPAEFANILITDLELPSYVQQEITESIEKQIEDYAFATALQLPSNKEYHVIIDLAVSLDKQLYEDRFEWDLKQDDVTPEEFADIVVGDMGLALEFKPAVAHALHEVLLRLKREIADGTYNYELHKYQQLSGLLFEHGIRITTESSIHNGNDQWEPVVEILTPWEIEKREIERERNIRRLKRENMRREVDDGPHKRRAFGRRRHDDFDGWRGL